MTKKKSGFFTFCCSLLPGAGEMYMGFMKMGVSIMGLFWLLIALAAMLNIGPIMFITVILWFYSFFHVHNLAGLTDEQFAEVKDEYLFSLDTLLDMDRAKIIRHRNAIATVLIILGVVLLWNGFIDICYSYLPDEIVRILRNIGYSIPQMLVGAAIVICGFYIIRGKKKELDSMIGIEDDNAPETDGTEKADISSGNN